MVNIDLDGFERWEAEILVVGISGRWSGDVVFIKQFSIAQDRRRVIPSRSTRLGGSIFTWFLIRHTETCKLAGRTSGGKFAAAFNQS